MQEGGRKPLGIQGFSSVGMEQQVCIEALEKELAAKDRTCKQLEHQLAAALVHCKGATARIRELTAEKDELLERAERAEELLLLSAKAIAVGSPTKRLGDASESGGSGKQEADESLITEEDER